MKKVKFNLSEELEINDLATFLESRNKILIRRNLGGLGDIFMHRMMFEDFKLIAPQIHLTFACPSRFHDAVKDHPFLDSVIDCAKVNEKHYVTVYNTSKVCSQYELATMPLIDKHRSDIWANSCGVNLTSHNMHFRFTDEEVERTKKKLTFPYALIAPVTAMGSKNLDVHQCKPSEERLTKLGLKVYYLHNQELPHGHTLVGLSTREFMVAISLASLVISADTAAFHCSGGLGIPMVAVFGWADGKLHSKYFKNVELAQKHRDNDPLWCGPCYDFFNCCKQPDINVIRKPCITDLSGNDILEGLEKLLAKI